MKNKVTANRISVTTQGFGKSASIRALERSKSRQNITAGGRKKITLRSSITYDYSMNSRMNRLKMGERNQESRRTFREDQEKRSNILKLPVPHRPSPVQEMPQLTSVCSKMPLKPKSVPPESHRLVTGHDQNAPLKKIDKLQTIEILKEYVLDFKEIEKARVHLSKAVDYNVRDFFKCATQLKLKSVYSSGGSGSGSRNLATNFQTFNQQKAITEGTGQGNRSNL